MRLRKNAFILPEKGANQEAQEFTPALLKAFLEEIVDLLKTSYAKDGYTKKIWIRQKYEFHFKICKEGEFVRKALWENMVAIYHAWQEKNKDGRFILSDERKLSYALLLEEGASGCSRGFLDRVHFVTVSCENKFSLPHILHMLRREIVGKVAAIYTDRGEIHGYNTTFNIANELAFGVKGLQEDNLSGGVDKAAITEALIKAFDNAYSPMAIVHYLMDYLRNTMISFGYKGRREKKYEFKIFGKWVEILKQFFLEFKNISADMEDFFLCNDDGFVIDLHWRKIHELLWEYLLTHFFVSDDETKDVVLRFLFGENEKYTEEDFNVLMGTLIKKKEDFFYFINNLQDPIQKELCLNAFLDFSTSELEFLFIESLKDASFENAAQFLLTQLPPHFLSEYGGIALVLAAKNHPTVVPFLLDVIGKLSEERQAAILNARTKKNWTALMLAARYHPTAVPFLLDAIGKLPEETQVAILNAGTKKNWTALMLAALHHPTVVPLLLDVIGKLPEETQVAILNVGTQKNWTALMLAAMYHPTVVPFLLDVIGKLPKEAQAAILNAKNNDGWTALMLAVKHQPTAVPFLVDAIGKLPEEAQAAILNAKNSDGWTALMLAVKHQPTAVPFLVEIIGKLSEENQVEILNAKANDGLTLFMMAAGNYDTALPPLLDVIEKLSKEKQADILNAKVNDNWTALMAAARYRSTVVPLLLKTIGKLSKEKQADILSVRNKNGSTALMLAARSQPTAVPFMLDVIGKLPEETQAAILSAKNNDGWTALMLAAEYQPSAVPFFLRGMAALEKANCEILLREASEDAKLNFETKKVWSGLDAILNGQENEIPQALAIEGRWIRWVPEKLKGNVDMALIAIAQNPKAIDYINDSLQQEIDFIKLANIENAGERKKACNKYKKSAEYQKLKLLHQLDEYIEEVKNTFVGFLQEHWRSNQRPSKIAVAEKMKDLLQDCSTSSGESFTEKEWLILRKTPCLREASQFLNQEAPNNIPVMIPA